MISPEILWNALVDSVPFYVAVVSADRRLEFQNRALLRGVSIDQRGFGIEPLGSALDRVLAGGPAEQVEVPLELDPGQSTWVRLHVARLPGADEEPRGALVVGFDITESKQAAIELRMSVNALHRMIEAREQLAADLHDGILQALYAVGLQLEVTRSLLKGRAEEGHLARAIGALNATMAEIRRFIAGSQSELPPSMEWEETLVGTLHGLEIEGGATIEVLVEREGAQRVPEEHRGELLLIAREAVSNAVRHAKARRIMVRLTDAKPGARMDIEDDGCGFEQSPNGSGLGLLTMTRRASRIGAILTVQSEPNVGTLVRVDFGTTKESTP